MRVLSCASVVSLLLAAHVAGAAEQAQTYKRIGPDGVVEFTDTPGPDAEPVEISPPVTYQAPALPRFEANAGPQSEAAVPPMQVEIVSPRDDEAVVDTAGGVSIQVEVAPPPGPTRQLRFLLDGAVVATGTDTGVALENVDRGTHSARVQLVDAGGEILVESRPVTFHLIRPSVNLPGRPKPNPPSSGAP